MTGTDVKDEIVRSLRHARVVFTGRLALMSRRQAVEVVRDAGGIVGTNVSRRTSMLVVGLEGWPVLPDGSVSRHMRRAEELRSAGAGIEIVSEVVFLERLGLVERRALVQSGYSREQACRTLGLDHAVLARWEALGLIRASDDGRYDFQDLVSLRTIAELSRAGVPLATIGKTVRGLASILSDVERPLAQLQLVEQNGALLAEVGDALLSCDGQMLMRFDPATTVDLPEIDSDRLDLVEPKDPAAGPGCPDDWIDYGHDLEEAERFDDAVEAYRRALSIRPRFPAACFNLANALRALDRLEDAEEQLLAALEQDPAMAAAWYNLADVQEELGRPDDAIASLRAALEILPAYADAHYNLALCYERTGQPEQARVHWKAYLGLDGDSQWADEARRHLSCDR